jgi:hypothetical protein
MHKPTCTATEERRVLTQRLADAIGLDMIVSGTEAALNEVYGYLQGVVPEYQDDGDQMVEACDCGGWKS